MWKWVVRLAIAGLIVIPGLLAFLTLVWFVNPSVEDVSTAGQADAVVLFAGSPDRLQTAVQLMDAGAAPTLVVPNGTDIAESLCGSTRYRVLCPVTATIDTRGEAREIGKLASEGGWTSVIAVTSTYHVHRATFLLGRCFEGDVRAVSPPRDYDIEDLVDHVAHEWAGLVGAMVLQPGC